MTLFPEKNHEIGSEFWAVPLAQFENKLLPDKTRWFLSGRVALDAIIKDIKKRNSVNTAALPSWCCDSMIVPFLKNNINVKFYSVCFKEGKLHQNLDEAEGADIIFLIDYFGFEQTHDVKFDGIKICDITHSVFRTRQKDADYYFGSFRKWAGFLTGGFAYKKDGELLNDFNVQNGDEYVMLRKEAMNEKKDYINGLNNTKGFLEKFSKAEELLDSGIIGSATESDIQNALFLDVELIRKKRRENAEILIRGLCDFAVFKEMKEGDCPLLMPLYIQNGKRDELKKHLIDKKIYCPVHWAVSEFHKLNSSTEKIYKNEISIVCDQRYDTDDMQRIVSEIKKVL